MQPQTSRYKTGYSAKKEGVHVYSWQGLQLQPVCYSASSEEYAQCSSQDDESALAVTCGSCHPDSPSRH